MRTVALTLLLGLASSGVAQVPSLPDLEALAGKGAGDLVMSEGAYLGHAADWGWLLVPERRGQDGTRTIRLIVVRERALERSESPPIFNLVGGPGASNIWGSGEIPDELMTGRDVVRVGYRGIDSSQALSCPECTLARQDASPLSNDALARLREALRACRKRLEDEGVDVGAYALPDVVEDIEAARAALGYERISFLGASFGSQIALSYAQAYPERVERMLLVGACGVERGMNLWHAEQIDRVIRDYAELWEADDESRARSPDIVETIRRVLDRLPRDWRGVRIDPGKVRLGTWYMLRHAATAAQVLDAYADADDGDWAGIALLSWGYDAELEDELTREYGPYQGEFYSKAVSTLDPALDDVSMDDPSASIIGSPAARYMWGVADAWPMDRSHDADRNAACAVPTLILQGDLDVATPVEYVRDELMPILPRGHLEVFPRMGHMDPVTRQPDAFLHLATRWFDEGIVDVSAYEPNELDFSPSPSLADTARAIIPKPR